MQAADEFWTPGRIREALERYRDIAVICESGFDGRLVGPDDEDRLSARFLGALAEPVLGSPGGGSKSVANGPPAVFSLCLIKADLDAALSCLPAPGRWLTGRHYVQGHTLADIALAVDVPDGSVRRWAKACREKMSAILTSFANADSEISTDSIWGEMFARIEPDLAAWLRGEPLRLPSGFNEPAPVRQAKPRRDPLERTVPAPRTLTLDECDCLAAWLREHEQDLAKIAGAARRRCAACSGLEFDDLLQEARVGAYQAGARALRGEPLITGDRLDSYMAGGAVKAAGRWIASELRFARNEGALGPAPARLDGIPPPGAYMDQRPPVLASEATS